MADVLPQDKDSQDAKRWRFFRQYMFEDDFKIAFPFNPEDADRLIDEGIEATGFEK